MGKTIHVSINDHLSDPATFPFCFTDGNTLYRGDAARNFLNIISNRSDILQFEFEPYEQERFNTQILPNLPQPNKSRLHSIEQSIATNQILSDWQLTYVMQPKISRVEETAEFSQLLADANDCTDTFLTGVSKIMQSDTSALARTKFNRIHSNKATHQEFLKRYASQGIADYADDLLKINSKVGTVLTVGKHITKAAQRYMQEDYSVTGVIAHAGYDVAADCLQENVGSILIGATTRIATRQLLLVGGSLAGITVTGGFSVVVLFAAETAIDYLFVEYVWNPTVESFRQGYLDSFVHSKSQQTTVPGGSTSQTSLVMDLPSNEQIKQNVPTLLIDLIDNPHKNMPDTKIKAAMLSKMGNLAQNAKIITFFPGKMSVAPKEFSISTKLGNELTYEEKVARFQDYIKEHFDYSNPVYNNINVFSTTNLFYSDRFSSQQSNQGSPYASFFLNNYSGRLNGGVIVDASQQPELATFLFGLHILKGIYNWHKMPETEKCRVNIQTLIKQMQECKEGAWWSYNTFLRGIGYNKEQIIEKHMQNLDGQLEKLAQLDPSSQDIFYFKKIMHYFITTNNQDAILAIAGNDIVEIKRYSDMYAEKFYSYSRLAIDSLIESNIKQAVHTNNKLQEGFSSEPLTHAINAAVLCEKKQFSLGENALDTAKKMALRDLNFSKREWKEHSARSSELYCSPFDADINFYTNDFQQFLKKAEEQYDNINKMEINFYEKAYQYSSEKEKNIFWQKWHDSVNAYVVEHPYSESAKLQLANVYLTEERFNDAIKIYQKIQNKSPAVLFSLGNLLYKTGDNEQAVTILLNFELTRKEYSKIDEKYLCAAIILEKIYIDRFNETHQAGDLDGAIKQARFILSLPKNNESIITEQAWFLGLNGFPEEGLHRLQKVLNDFTDLTERNSELFSKINNAMGDCYFLLNKPDQALRYYTAVLGRDPSNPHVLINCARAVLRCGNFQQARLLVDYTKRKFPEICEEIHPDFKYLDFTSSEIQSFCLDAALQTHCIQLGIQFVDMGLNKLMEQDYGDWTPSVKIACFAVKVSLAAMPFLESCSKHIEVIYPNEKAKAITDFTQALIKYKIPVIELEGAAQRMLGAENGHGYLALHGVTFLCSALLIIDQAKGGSLFPERYREECRTFVATTLNIAGIVGKIDAVYNTSKGIESLSTIHQLFGAALADKLIYIDAGTFFIARSFDAGEFIAKYLKHEIPESSEYHLAKCTIQGASFGLVVGKVATLAATRWELLVIPPEPTTATVACVTALTAASIGAGMMWGWSHYESSQLAAIISNADTRYEKDDLLGALEKINEACDYKPNHAQLELKKCGILVMLALKDNDIKQAVEIYDEFSVKFPNVLELEDNLKINQNYLKLKSIHKIKILTESANYIAAIKAMEEHINSCPKEDANIQYLITLYSQKWDKLLEDKDHPIPLNSRLESALEECGNLKNQYETYAILDDKYERLQIQKLALDKNYQLAIPKVEALIERTSDKKDKQNLISYRKNLSQAFIIDLSIQARTEIDYQQALNACIKHLLDYPNDPVILNRHSMLRCVSPLSSNNYEAAIIACNDRLEHFSIDDTDALRYRMRAYIGLNKFEEAENDAQHILRINSKDSDALFQRSIIYLNRGYLQQALDDVGLAISSLNEKILDVEETQVLSYKSLLENYKNLENTIHEKIGTIKKQTVSVILGNAISSGISYWAQSSTIENSASMPFLFFTTRETPTWAPQTSSSNEVMPLSLAQCFL